MFTRRWSILEISRKGTRKKIPLHLHEREKDFFWRMLRYFIGQSLYEKGGRPVNDKRRDRKFRKTLLYFKWQKKIFYKGERRV